MSADKLVFDLSQEVEGSPQVFIKKDWLNILDNMNQNYNSNQTIIDTSQLSNSNKWVNYREAYLAVPLIMTLTTTTPFVRPDVTGPVVAVAGFIPAVPTIAYLNAAAGVPPYPTACDYVLGLKNWFGTMIHSFTLDCNGTTIIQQTPLISMVNCFRLMTSLSWGDVLSQGSTIGFYPDCPTSFMVSGNGAGSVAGSPSGQGVCNNTLYPANPLGVATIAAGALTTGSGCASQFANWNSGAGNSGLVARIQNINFDPQGWVGGVGTTAGTQRPAQTLRYQTLLPVQSMANLWAGSIFNKFGSVAGDLGVLQIQVLATIYLKHIHNFFAMIPLLKGTFLKMTAFLNNSVVPFTIAGKTSDGTSITTFGASLAGVMTLPSVPSVPVGGVCPLMLTDTSYLYGGSGGLGNGSYVASLSVGGKVLGAQASLANVLPGTIAQSIYLYVPAYTFNPVFESAYLSSPVKSVKYSDYYQYQIQSIGAGSQFNNLLTNGIANIKSILICPYYSQALGATTQGLPTGMPVYQSPFDPAGAGATSPLCLFTNFNVVVSGQNAIYNTQMRMLEQFNNQGKGCNAVNGDMTDGLTSGLINSLAFESSQCFYYVNLGRQLPVEEAVPKSVQLIGTNMSGVALDLICFIEYGVSVDFDCLTGARV